MSHLRNDLLCGRQNKDRSLFLILSEKPVSPLFLQKIPPDAVLFAWVMGDFFLGYFYGAYWQGAFLQSDADGKTGHYMAKDFAAKNRRTLDKLCNPI